MAYSEIEQYSLDLNIFFKDDEKVIHLASGGGRLPLVLIGSDEYNDTFFDELMQIPPKFEVEINPEIRRILDLNGNNEVDIQRYLHDFTEIARRGIYSYDKTRLGEYENMEFHLVAKPATCEKINMNTKRLIEVETILSDEFRILNLENLK